MKFEHTSPEEKEKSIGDRFKRWIYAPKIIDGKAVMSDGTTYIVDGLTGAFRRIGKKSSQRFRRRMMGRQRRLMNMTRSEFYREIQNPKEATRVEL